MPFRQSMKRGSARRACVLSSHRRRVLVEQLEGRQLLAADIGLADIGFVETLPTAEEAGFGSMVLTSQGRDACLAFRAIGGGEGEGAPVSAPGDAMVDLSASITDQPAGPLALNAPFSSTITFENLGPDSASGTTLDVSFDTNLAGITWQREIFRAQSPLVSAADLDGENGLRVQGEAANANAGGIVTGVGDLNNDGFQDFGIASRGFAVLGGLAPLQIVYGTNTGFPAEIDLATPLTGSNGFQIDGLGSAGGFSLVAAAAGDINGDLIDDLVVGSPGDLSNQAGSAFVIFGKDGGFGASFDASTLNGGNGFSVSGIAPNDSLGSSVSGAGDINGDGVADVIMSAPNSTAGEAYVIFGKPNNEAFGATIDLTSLNGTNGLTIRGANEGDLLGAQVDHAGDVNGDTFDDLLVTAPQTGAGVIGEAYVIYGKPSTSPFDALIEVSDLNGTNGFSIAGLAARTNQAFGTEASGLGDVNGDGFADLVIAEASDPDVALGGARAYVVFGFATNGSSSGFDLSTLNGSNGFEVSPTASPSNSFLRVSGVGDVNGDTFNDLLFGSAESIVGTTPVTGGAWVLYGKDTASSAFAPLVNLSTLDGSDGFAIEGIDEGATRGLFGEAVGGAGDVNGDGLSDVLVGAPFRSPGGVAGAGESYVVFGRGSTFTQGTGAINEVVDLGPGDRVVYSVSATIAAAAEGPAIVQATATVGTGVEDTAPGNNTTSATTLTPPRVESIQINDGGATRSQITSITVTFDQLVDEALLNSAFVVTQIDSPPTQVGTINVSSDSTSGKTISVLTFDGVSTVSRLGGPAGTVLELGDSLADGNYRLDVLAAQVQAGDVAMSSDEVFGGQTAAQTPNDNFFRLYGDADGDGDTDLDDLFDRFSPALFSSSAQPNFDASLDGDGDDDIDLDDLFDFFSPNLFASRL